MRLHDYLEYWAIATPGQVCVTDGARSYTYAEMDAWADRVASALAELGIPHGGRLGVLAANCPEWIAIYYGAFKSGAVPVPLNYRLHPTEWEFLISDSTATAVLVQDSYVDRIASVRSNLPAVCSWVVIDGNRTDWLSLPTLVAAADPDAPRPTIDVDHDCWQMYTSGTTGLPKGAVLTHRCVQMNMLQAHMDPVTLQTDKSLVVMPMYHAGAAMSTLSNISAGATIRLMARFDANECVRVLAEERITRTTFVPAMIQAILSNVPDIATRDFSHLRLLSYGASAISAQTLRQALDVFDCDFRQAFGQTETSGGLTCLTARDHRRVLDAGDEHLLLSCGRALPGTEIAIVDGDGTRVPLGEPGEIIARGPQMMRGYWNRADADAKTLVDGWLHTGDIGRMDVEGFVYISDRIKDMIVSGGENIYPREIENVLFAMPEVSDAAVIGVPDARWGETVKAIVVVREGCSVTEQDIIRWTRTRLATYKAPASVDFVAELPRNPSGKVLKTVLREPYWSGTSRWVG